MEEGTSPRDPANARRIGYASVGTWTYLDRALELPVAKRDAWLHELESREPRIAADIRRHQHGLTVSAYDGVWIYRAAKFSKRNATALIIAGLAIFTIAVLTTW